jgi:hypothetical protein
MKKINVLFTFDYELPLGRLTGSYDDALFKPTNHLLELAERLDFKIVLFADILSYLFFKQHGITAYTRPFEAQLQEAITKGHDVQLHLHPHWLESSMENGTFQPSNKFKLGDFFTPDNPGKIHEIIRMGVDELTTICRQSNPTYRCIAYRGGGYNLEPHSALIIEGLKSCGIRYDSSVVPGYYFKSAQNCVDYTRVPNLPNWYLSDSGNLNESGKEGILEIPVASAKKRPFELPTFIKTRLKKYQNRAPQSFGQMIHVSHTLTFAEKWKMRLANRMLTVDNHAFSPEYLQHIHRTYVNRFHGHEEISFALIGHPKTMGDYALKLVESYTLFIRNQREETIEIHTFETLHQHAQTHGIE